MPGNDNDDNSGINNNAAIVYLPDFYEEYLDDFHHQKHPRDQPTAALLGKKGS